MKTHVIIGALLLTAASLHAADPTPKDDVTKAAKQLGDKPNYSWSTKVVVPESAQFKPGPTEGKTEKDGFTHLTMTFGDNATEGVIKGDKSAVIQDGEWKTTSELESSEGPGRFLGWIVRNVKTPAVQAAELAAAAKDLKKEGEVYSSDLTEEGAKAQFRFGTPKDAKASVKFWLKDGALAKYEFKVLGKIEFNGNEMDVDRTTTVEIKEVGTTKLSVPEAAKKKVS